MAVSHEKIYDYFFPFLKESGKKYRKTSLVKAKLAEPGQEVITKTSDGVEIKCKATKGDLLIENQTSTGEVYLMKGDKFEKRYQMKQALDKGWAVYQSNFPIQAIQLETKHLTDLGIDSEFEFETPWQDTMKALIGDFIVLSSDDSGFYRIAQKEFLETYKEV